MLGTSNLVVNSHAHASLLNSDLRRRDVGVIFLGTVAIEPNRWGLVNPNRQPTIDAADWLDEVADIGFDGIELWEGHATEAVADHLLPVPVFNSYASLDDPDDTARRAAADWARRLGSTGVKCNVGADPTAERTYVERLATWSSLLPDGVALLCECHAGTIAEDPAVAGRILAAAGPPDRVGAIVHTHEDAEGLRQRFAHAGDRIAHVHVNLLDGGRQPKLRDVRDRLASTINVLRSLGFAGTWTLEFVNGLLTADDHPAALLVQARDDLAVLRELVG